MSDETCADGPTVGGGTAGGASTGRSDLENVTSRETVVYRANAAADGGGSVSMAVVEALADAEGVPAVDLDRPLFDTVDPDALDRLFEYGALDGPDGRVTFSVTGYEVTVTGAGDVSVRPE